MTNQQQPTQDAAQHTARERDIGSTFVEIVVTIVLIGIVVIPILAAVRSSIRASTTTEAAAEVETLLVNAVDRVNRNPVAACDPTQVESAVDAAVETNGWPPSAASVTLEYMQADGSWSSTVGPEGCANQVLLVTITIADPDSGLQRRIEVVKGEY